MKRTARQQPTGLQQLEGLPLRLIALKLSNPAPLAASCGAVHRSISTGGDFEIDWFLRWAHVLAPLRPWQHAAIGWQRLGGTAATAEVLCDFIMRVSETKRQQGRHLHPQESDPAATPGQVTEQDRQQPQQQQQPAAAQGDAEPAAAVQAPELKRRPQFSPIPFAVPLPSVVRQARRLLSRGKPISALARLCPGGTWLLHQYAAAAGNVQLLQQLIASQPGTQELYPTFTLLLAAGGSRVVNVAQQCAYAAMKAGHTSVLEYILFTSGASIKGRPFQVTQLFRFACRHSSAACLQLVMDFAPCTELYGCSRLQAWPQHLAMAASRVDPWAANVVALLLQVMSPKLLAAKFMAPAYTAACRTGYAPVVQQLLRFAAAAPHKHLDVLLKAAACAGNLSTWQQLLPVELVAGVTNTAADAAVSSSAVSSSAAASSSDVVQQVASGGSTWLSFFSRWLSRQPAGKDPVSATQQEELRQQQQQQQQEAKQLREVCEAVPKLPWHNLQAADWSAALLLILDGMCSSKPRLISGQVKLRLAADEDRAAMAASMWQLVGSSGLQEAVRTCVVQQLSTDQCPWASFGAMQQLLTEALPGKVVWLLQYQLLPQVPQEWQAAPVAAEGLQNMITFSLKHGLHQAAAGLWQLARQLQVQIPQRVLVQGCMDGGVWAAAVTLAAPKGSQDLAALQQLVVFGKYCQAVNDAALHSGPCKADGVSIKLLHALSCVWNAAVLIDLKAPTQQMGLPLQQHLRHSAAALAPILLKGVHGLGADDVVQLFEAVCGSQHAQHHGLCSGSVARLEMQQLQDKLDADGPHVVRVDLCLQQLCGEWGRWLSGATPHLVAPAATAGSGLVSLELSAVVDWLQSDSEHGLGAIAAYIWDQLLLLLPAPGRPAAHVVPSSGSVGNSSAAAVAALAASIDGLAGRAVTTQGAGCCGIMPLWQLAGLALAAPGSQPDGEGWVEIRVEVRVDPDIALEAALQPVVHTAATPSFLEAAARSHTAAMPSSCAAALPAGSPACPPEHRVVRGIMGVLQRVLCQWAGSQHRLDVLAWALHPQQHQLWALAGDAFVASLFLIRYATTFGGYQATAGRYQQYASPLVHQHERAVRQHQQQRAAGVSQGFGPLPHFAAAAADAATTLLAVEPFDMDKLATSVSGCSSIAVLEHVKAMFAVILATPSKQLHFERYAADDWPLMSASAVRKAAETGDRDLLTMVALQDLRMWVIRHQESLAQTPA